MSSNKIKIMLVVWLIVSFINFGAINAYEKHELPLIYNRAIYSSIVLIAILPGVGSVLAVLTTGFCEYGFDWTWTHRMPND